MRAKRRRSTSRDDRRLSIMDTHGSGERPDFFIWGHLCTGQGRNNLSPRGGPPYVLTWACGAPVGVRWLI